VLFSLLISSLVHADNPAAEVAAADTLTEALAEAPPVVTPDTPVEADPFGWLEAVEGEESLTWARARNDEATAALAAAPVFSELEERLRATFDSTDRIPFVALRGDQLYNFWRDADHPKGIWRRTTQDSYRTETPDWEIVLDVDALGEAEGESWVWHGARCLPPEYARCLVSLSPGGSDAAVVREFDTTTSSFVEGGFALPLGKNDAGWVDIDHIQVGVDLGEGSLTESGYPRTGRLWTRGTPLESAEVLFEGETTDVAAGLAHDHTPGWERDWAWRMVTFFTNELYEITSSGLVKVDKPDQVSATVHQRWILFEYRKDWEVAGTAHPSGSLLVADYKKWKKGKRKVTVLFEPGERTSLADWDITTEHVVLEILDTVRSRIEVLTPERKDWTRAPLAGLPELGEVTVWPVDTDHSDALWLRVTGFLTPSSLGLVDLGEAPQMLKSEPAFFDATDRVVTQHMATSKDGTQIPYFQIAPTGIPEGGLPTLLYGYGGFEVSLKPRYSSSAGIGWIEPGGVYVIANIRGGGEFGPRWHQAALKEKRHKAYEDFAAIGEDLVARGVTTVAQLGIQGGSNGGLLMGNMLTTYPDHWGAVVCQVPLLDMKHYTKLLAGASWAGEYGDPDDPEQWAYLQKYSPYHNVDSAADYPPILFTTSTRDDRVHPGHARKMAALLAAHGKDVTYYENIEGGHGGAADNAQAAFMRALSYRFLWTRLVSEPAETEAEIETEAGTGAEPQ